MAFSLRTANGGTPLVFSLDDRGRVTGLRAGALSFDAFPLDLEVQDDLRKRIYSCRDAATEKTDDFSFVRRWADCDFTLHENWRVEGKMIVRRLRAEPVPGAAMRAVTIRIPVSYPEDVYSLTAWSANQAFPRPLPETGGLKLFYEDVCYGTVLPAVAVYSAKERSGLTFGARLGARRGGRLAFAFRDYHAEGIDVEFSCLLLRGGHPADCELLYAATQGCYRSALAFWKEAFPAFFAAPVPVVSRAAGPFFISNPRMSEEYLDEVKERYAPLWAEVHNHFPRYGEYAPEAPAWESVIVHDYPEADCREKFTPELVNRHIAELHRRNILAMLYFQASGDCFTPYAEAVFPDAVARDSAGRIVKTWKDCCFVSAMPGTSFHAHLMKQIDRFFALYPDMDGVFLDQLCYHMLDYAHADGLTAVETREAARYGDSYAVPLARIAEILHRAGKSLWANGPFSIEVAKDVDGMMSEGTGDYARTYQYMTCGGKGLLVHSYASSASDVESMFRMCLVCGGSWSVSGEVAKRRPEKYPDKVEELFRLCGPLADLLAGCVWVLEPEPFSLPEEYEGNLYELPGGRLALTVVSRHDTLLRPARAADPSFRAAVKCSAACRIVRAENHSVDGIFSLDIVREDGGISFAVTGHRVFSAVILSLN
ncbi:MAG: hypothetical protein IJU70_13850 [Lentisphaeria bacterium]|nr:hypothetical protein [Lentisphaeria bacterium]